ncbi:anti-sigma factor [Saccharospirillum salsuginis]|uniref:Anti-sigma K factor RskA C-terminal domain-containing protein n=1 Tax=Saccharospirillum salsuginis TaxID=418750 RepID=A0A918KBF7_9GAMM|nr:anti-sigma factor [Saccharospirillum salsuginis]GGX57807.1 hypothetical protein GCM10007392_26820 [Saccharospirillum salsuginis]
MKKTPERIERLASEYVLGSLTGGARRRFERWMVDDRRVRQEVRFWEEKLGVLAQVLPEQRPRKQVWNAIEQRLWPEQKQRRSSWIWPTWSALASLAVVILASVLLVTSEESIDTPPHLAGAVVSEQGDAPLWLINEAQRTERLNVRSVAASQADAGKDYELWIVPDDADPISLGVVPVGGTHSVSLTPVTRAALQQSQTLAISLEPEGGSPTGAPTGPILHVVRLYPL